MVGFAGPRVIEQTIHQKLPEGFQRSEFLQTHGFVDAVVERKDIKKYLYNVLRLHVNRKCEKVVIDSNLETVHQKNVDREKTAWERVQISRAKDRPSGSDIFMHFLRILQNNGVTVAMEMTEPSLEVLPDSMEFR